MTYANTVFGIMIPLTDHDITDVAEAIETELCRLGVNPDIAIGCVRITVGPPTRKVINEQQSLEEHKRA